MGTKGEKNMFNKREHDEMLAEEIAFDEMMDKAYEDYLRMAEDNEEEG
jgi:hypothetical protein